MQLALMVEGQEGVTWDDWCALADACEEHGIGTLFRSDHYISQGDEFHKVAHDAWTIIAGGSGKRGTVEPALRFADEYNAPFVSVAEAAEIREKTRPLRFSVMTSCLVGETHDDAVERARELYSVRQRPMAFEEWLEAFK